MKSKKKTFCTDGPIIFPQVNASSCILFFLHMHEWDLNEEYLKDYIITQTLINETALNCGYLKQFPSLLFFDYCCVLKITEN